MSQQVEEFVEDVDGQELVVDEPAAPKEWSRERGMTTAEYAIGVVLVVTLVGLVITAMKSGVFTQALQQAVVQLLKVVTGAMG
ncbi:DUF4244 domain-containing protein [Nigerium massiliense]|uniref:DUF4244 domain-containing protein n=1 Tax=Nigerium massiliense TaxID=1522317 RepID=UPI00058D2767|nr:DUF4244 domain-containing protein [Nigerium massiliense]